MNKMTDFDRYQEKNKILETEKLDVNLQEIYKLYDKYNFSKLTKEQYNMLKIIQIKILLYNSEVLGLYKLYDIPYEEDVKVLEEKYNILSNLLVAMFNNDSVKIDVRLFLCHYAKKSLQNVEKKDSKYIEILLTKAFIESQSEEKLRRFLSS